MRIAILTFHRAYNCGAMLQAWALKTVLARMGHQVEFPACNSVGERKRWPLSWFGPFRPGLRFGVDLFRRWRYNLFSIPNEGILIKRYKAFRTAHLPERKVCAGDFASHYDLVILGSDQIWNSKITKTEAGYFLGETLPAGLRVVSYAASFGDVPPDGGDLSRVVACVKRLEAVSVREYLAKDKLGPLTQNEIFVAADPTLLLDAEDYNGLAAGDVPSAPYLFLYTVPNDPFVINTARELARRLGVRCVISPCYQFSRYGAPREAIYGVSPERLVQYAKHAKYILACSFHGTVMGILFQKPFLSLRRSVDQSESRPASLLRTLGCAERLVNPSVTIEEMHRRLTKPLPDLTKRIAMMRTESMSWLQGTIAG